MATLLLQLWKRTGAREAGGLAPPDFPGATPPVPKVLCPGTSPNSRSIFTRIAEMPAESPSTLGSRTAVSLV